MSDPVKVVGIEISADQPRAREFGGLVHHRLKLAEPLIGIDTRVEVRVPDPQVAGRTA